MRKYIILLLILLLCMTGCGRNEVDPELVITCAPREEALPEATQSAAENGPEPVDLELVFLAEAVELVPGAPFDSTVLPAPDSLYQVPSCAIEGTDNLYNYGTFELTAFNDGTGEVIYSILLLTPDVTTPEGLALGDEGAKVTELYGTAFTQEGTARVYTDESAKLYVIVQNDTVASIEYRMITE